MLFEMWAPLTKTVQRVSFQKHLEELELNISPLWKRKQLSLFISSIASGRLSQGTLDGFEIYTGGHGHDEPGEMKVRNRDHNFSWRAMAGVEKVFNNIPGHT